MAGVPVQVPVSLVTVWPSSSVPVIAGRVWLTGGAGATCVVAGLGEKTYLGKHGWNAVRADGGLDPRVVHDMLEDSYDLVVASLPVSRRPG